jgi:uncharacterized membrane protein (GlpM family)
MVAFIGMFFLYKLTFLITKDWIKSISLVAIAMTSPVYAYYFNGFIPSIPALTFMIIAYYCYFKYLTNNELKEFNVAILFCTLSTLTRSSFLVAYIAILCFEFLRILKKETSYINKIMPLSISFAVILLYYFWNRHLANENGTLFLGDLMLAQNWEDFVYRITKAKDNWKLHYFTNRHYWIFALVIVSAIFYGVFNFIKRKKENLVERNNVGLSLWWLCGILFFGNICFLVAMVRQFPNHDYYFIDTFFLPILLLMILAFNVLPKIVNFKQAVLPMALSLFFMVFMLKDVNDSLEHAKQLVELIRPTYAYVNLIPYNPVDEHGYQRAESSKVKAFMDYCIKHGVNTTIRKEFGTDIDAACGQLRAKQEGKI